MKKLTLILLAFVLIVSACKKDEEEEDTSSSLNPTASQKGFGINYTATWCFHCGDWGADRIHKYATDAPHGAILTAHASGDPMNNSALYSSLSSDRATGGGIPSFWAGDVSKASDGAMATLVASGNAQAGVDISYEKSGNKMTVKTATKFFSPNSGDYYLTVLVLEDGIDGSDNSGSYKQKGAHNPSTYKHDFVMRKSATAGNAYGELIASNPSDGKLVEKTYTITLDASWKDTYPVAIVWRKESGSAPEYKYINAIKKK
jgi:uncharacterized lipoprotein YehR (DUF1307 family)